MDRVRIWYVVATLAFVSCLPGSPAVADGLKFGLRGGYYSGIKEPFVGAELVVPLAHRFYFNPNFEYVFVSSGSYVTYNADFHYDIAVERPVYVWVGGGLGVVADHPGGANDTTKVAANFIGGIGFRAGPVIPYFQAKVIAKNDSIFSIAFGVRF